MLGSVISASVPEGTAAPKRTIRVELASGTRTVTATLPEDDEASLLDLLRQARACTV